MLPRLLIAWLLATALLAGCATTPVRPGYRENLRYWTDLKTLPASAPWATCIDTEIAAQIARYRAGEPAAHHNKGERFVTILAACKEKMAGFDWTRNIDANVERMIAAAYDRYGLALEEETKLIARGLLL
jgi:hypothetical protein